MGTRIVGISRRRREYLLSLIIWEAVWPQIHDLGCHRVWSQLPHWMRFLYEERERNRSVFMLLVSTRANRI
jgi:hypothetical protein